MFSKGGGSGRRKVAKRVPGNRTTLSGCSSFPGPPRCPVLLRDPVYGRVALQHRQMQRLRGRKREAGLQSQFRRMIRLLTKPAASLHPSAPMRGLIAISDLQDLQQTEKYLRGLPNSLGRNAARVRAAVGQSHDHIKVQGGGGLYGLRLPLTFSTSEAASELLPIMTKKADRRTGLFRDEPCAIRLPGAALQARQNQALQKDRGVATEC